MYRYEQQIRVGRKTKTCVGEGISNAAALNALSKDVRNFVDNKSYNPGPIQNKSK